MTTSDVIVDASMPAMIRAGGTEARAAMVEMITAQAKNAVPPAFQDPKVVGPIMQTVWQNFTAVADADVVVLLVDHQQFKKSDPVALGLADKAVVDTRGVWRG